MIISRTPFRLSFFGGGTDYPAWVKENGGRVLSTTIDKYCYITLRHLPPFFEYRTRIVYSKVEMCNLIDEIQHPVVREVLRYFEYDRGLEIHHDGDLPARSGIGSSSSFTVGFLNAMYGLMGKLVRKHQLAVEAIHVEQDLIGESVGYQDQVAAAYGGLNLINFDRGGEISVQPMTITPDRRKLLNDHLLLFYTGIQRYSSDVAATYDIDGKRKLLETMSTLTDEAVRILAGENSLKDFGLLLHEAWQTKKGLSSRITNSQVESFYDAAREAGALGGKLSGAGGGGFFLVFAPPEKHAAIKERLKDFICVPFQFDFQGSQVIYFDPQQDYQKEEMDRNARMIRPFQELEKISPAE